MASLPPDVVLIPSVLEFQCSFVILIHAAKYHHFARSNGKLQVAFSVFVTVPRNIPGDEAPGDRCRDGSAQDEASVRTQKTRMRLVRNAFRISLFWSFRKIVLCFSCGILYNKTGHSPPEPIRYPEHGVIQFAQHTTGIRYRNQRPEGLAGR